MAKEEHFIIIQVRSTIGVSKRQKDYLRSLGLKRIGSTVTRPPSQSNKALVEKVSHLVKLS